jgi:hypothetical protein
VLFEAMNGLDFRLTLFEKFAIMSAGKDAKEFVEHRNFKKLEIFPAMFTTGRSLQSFSQKDAGFIFKFCLE